MHVYVIITSPSQCLIIRSISPIVLNWILPVPYVSERMVILHWHGMVVRTHVPITIAICRVSTMAQKSVHGSTKHGAPIQTTYATSIGISCMTSTVISRRTRCMAPDAVPSTWSKNAIPISWTGISIHNSHTNYATIPKSTAGWTFVATVLNITAK